MLPFVMPSADIFLTSPKRVLAHYLELFQVQIDNVAANADYYTRNWLSRNGEGNKYLAQGGFCRARTNAVNPLFGVDFKLQNRMQEVRDAIAVGIGGFNYDIQNLADAMSKTGKMWELMNAALTVDPRFWVTIMPDMNSLAGTTRREMVDLITFLSTHPSIAHLPDGRMLVAPFNATNAAAYPGSTPLSFWQGVISDLDNKDIDIAFMPVLLGNPVTSVLDPISIGTSGWGTVEPGAASGPASFMNPAGPQQYRPKDCIFWESSCSAAFRNSLAASIAGGHNYFQLVTWNDMSESSMLRPYTDASLNPAIGRGYYEMLAYYATWFVTGKAPVITKDVLYWFYRKMQSNAARANQAMALACKSAAEETNIELVGFLTQPARLVINSSFLDVAAGVQPFKTPTAPGFPQFRLQRNGSDVFEFKGPVQIFGAAGDPTLKTLDMTYWSGSHCN